MVPKTKEIINKCYYLLSINSSFKETINNIQPMIEFHKNPSLNDLNEQLQRTNNKKQTIINKQKTAKNLLHLHKQQTQFNILHVTPVSHFAASKF